MEEEQPKRDPGKEPEGNSFTWVTVTPRKKTLEEDLTIRRHARRVQTEQRRKKAVSYDATPDHPKRSHSRRESVVKITPRAPVLHDRGVIQLSSSSTSSQSSLHEVEVEDDRISSDVEDNRISPDVTRPGGTPYNSRRMNTTSTRSMHHPQSDQSLTAVCGPFDILSQLAGISAGKASSPDFQELNSLPYQTQLRFNQYLLSFAELDNDASGILTPCVHSLGTYLARDTVLLFSFLSLIAALVGSLKHGPEPTQLPQEMPVSSGALVEFHDSYALKTKVAQFIRSRIIETRLISFSSIAAISMLAMSEAVSLGNVEVARLHCSGVFESIKLYGGIEAIPYYIRYSAWGADFKTAALSLAAPHFPVPSHMPPLENLHSILTDYPNQGTTKALPSYAQFVLSSQTISIINELRGLDVLGNLLLLAESNEDSRVNINLIPLYHHQIEHHLLTSISAFHGRNSLDRCTQIAILIFFYSTTWLRYPSLTMFAQVLARHLRSSLQSQVVKDALVMRLGLRVWILVMGVAVVEGRDQETWFLGQLRDSIILLGLRGADDLRDVLKQFLNAPRYGLASDRIFRKALGHYRG